MTWRNYKDEYDEAKREKAHTERLLRIFAVCAGLVLLIIVLAFLSGCDTLDQIRECVQRIDVNTDAMAQTIKDPLIQANRKDALGKISQAGEAFPWSEVFGGIISALLLAITGVQFKKFGMQKEVSKRGAKE